MKYFIVLAVVLSLMSCEEEKKEITASEIINNAIDSAGGPLYKQATIEFKFRENHYKSVRNGGEFHLERTSEDTLGNTYRDILSNTGFERYRNDTLVKVADSTARNLGSSVNSVHYFADLPYGLNDKAVNKSLAGDAVINGEHYYQVKITFQQDGGGAAHHDKFMYWINKKTFTVDYLAYKFHEDKTGIRFRVAYNPREINGIRFVDYKNYTVEDPNTDLATLDELYEQGKLSLLSDIKTEDVQVKIRE